MKSKGIRKRKATSRLITMVLSVVLAFSVLFCPEFSAYKSYAASIQLNSYQVDTRIRLNSIGFLPSLDKKATITANCTEFSLAKDNGEVVYTGKPTSMYNNDTSEQVSIADFSSVTQEGSYVLVVPGVGKSVTFKIANNVYLEPYKASMLAMYLSRCGSAVSAVYNGVTYSHAACHTNDAYTDYINGQHSVKNGKGGWHDAGDYNKYVVNAGITVGSMLFAWEQFKDNIDNIKLTMPENSNSIPDFLDEIKCETDWLLTMQYPDGSGKVSHKLSTKDFGGFTLPERETTDRYYSPWGSTATADFVAMLSMASRAFRPYDSAYADKLLNAAKVSYNFLKSNLNYTKPDQSAFTTGAYDSTDEDDRLWAAAEMWETTGDSACLNDFETRANRFTDKIDIDFDWSNINNLGMFTYLLSTRSGKNQSLYDNIKNSLISAANSIVNTRNNHGYGRPLGATYYWGCNGTVARQALILQIANKFSSKKDYINTALDALGFLFGRNYYDRSFVTGLGINPPKNPHHRPSGGDSANDPWPGYLVGGGWPGAKDWADNQDSYQTNEVAINWNGALIYALAGFVNTSSTPTDMYGDVNGDNVVDALDYATYKQYLLRQITSFPAQNGMKVADLNSDGYVDSIDFAVIRQYLLKQITKLPI